MAREYKVFHVKNDDQLSHCLNNEEEDGWELFQLIWTGNLQAQAPSLIGPGGDPTRIGIIHLYLVVFAREMSPLGTDLKLS